MLLFPHLLSMVVITVVCVVCAHYELFRFSSVWCIELDLDTVHSQHAFEIHSSARIRSYTKINSASIPLTSPSIIIPSTRFRIGRISRPGIIIYSGGPTVPARLIELGYL